MARVISAAVAPRRWRREPPVWTVAGLLIRRYTTDDHAPVFALHRECLAQVDVRPGDGVYYDDDFARIEEVYLREHGEFLVGELRGDTVAIGGLRRVTSAVAEMVRLRVRPDQQGRGYGAALVTVLEERAAELGYRLLRADTTVKQTVAIQLYRSFGWREVDRKATGTTVTVYFEKPLSEQGPDG
jgi:GNAT superfamily N-acetyltransferase